MSRRGQKRIFCRLVAPLVDSQPLYYILCWFSFISLQFKRDSLFRSLLKDFTAMLLRSLWKLNHEKIGTRSGSFNASTMGCRGVGSGPLFWPTLSILTVCTNIALGLALWRADASTNALCQNGFFSCPILIDKCTLEIRNQEFNILTTK